MKTKLYQLSYTSLVLIMLISLSGCNLAARIKASPVPTTTNTPAPTNTTPPTNTPLPTATFTEIPPSPIPLPTNTQPPAPPAQQLQPSATANASDAILIYYINTNEKGQYGCGEALWYVNTGKAYSKNVIDDVRYAFSTLLNYHQQKMGILYNPGYASKLAVNDVKFEDDGTLTILLTGEYVKTDDRCDGSRFKDQLKMLAKQFKLVKRVSILINGLTIGDVISK